MTPPDTPKPDASCPKCGAERTLNHEGYFWGMFECGSGFPPSLFGLKHYENCQIYVECFEESQSDKCRIAELERELAEVRRERDLLARFFKAWNTADDISCRIASGHLLHEISRTLMERGKARIVMTESAREIRAAIGAKP